MIELIEKAVFILNEKYNLPNKGYLAGGALGNTINYLIYGGDCIINDIDIYNVNYQDKKDFYGKEIQSNYYFSKKKFENVENNHDYLQMSRKINKDNYMELVLCERNKIFNFINYNTNKTDLNFLLETFDINVCQVGYDLETKQCYWTDDFQYYCNTKKLQVVLPSSPSHTAIRILKKRDELNAILEEKEIQLLVNIQNDYIIGSKRHWFSEKYLLIYEKYKNELSKYFNLLSRTITNNINSYNLYRLYPKDLHFQFPNYYNKLSMEWNRTYFDNYEENIQDYIDLYEYIKYYRNFNSNDENIHYIWLKFPLFFNNLNYLDGFDLNTLDKYKTEIFYFYKLVSMYKNIFLNLKNKTLLEQLEFLNWIKISDNPKKYYEILNHHKYPFKSKTFKEFEFEMNLFKIKYRYK